jgi:phage antirepressor YoqD-like protein
MNSQEKIETISPAMQQRHTGLFTTKSRALMRKIHQIAQTLTTAKTRTK